jgi:hypothetical protein
MKIIVDTLEEKKKLMEESRYIHNLKEVDTDKCNTLTHLYLCDDLIEVKHSHLARKKQRHITGL